MTSTILSSSRTDGRLKITFIKDQAFVTTLITLLGKFCINWEVFQDIDDTDTRKNKIIKINRIQDQLFHFEDQHIRIDIFVGHKKAIFVLNSTERMQQQVVDELSALSKWKLPPRLVPKRLKSASISKKKNTKK